MNSIHLNNKKLENNNKLYEKFMSNENKGIVWSLMNKDGMFNNIPSDKSFIIKETFDKKVNLIAEEINEVSDTIINLNKLLISNMIKYISVYNNSDNRENNILTELNTKNNNGISEIYNSSGLLKQRQDTFNKEVKIKEDEFNDLTKSKVPDTPNFSDTLDKPIGDEMNNLISKQKMMREQEMNGVFDNKSIENAKEWLELSHDRPDNTNTNNTNTNNNNNNTIIKKVKFEDNNENNTLTHDFMSLLKKTPNASSSSSSSISGMDNSMDNSMGNNINILLREILDKQNEILNLLKK